MLLVPNVFIPMNSGLGLLRSTLVWGMGPGEIFFETVAPKT